MDPFLSVATQIVLVLLLVIANGLFVAAEFAIVRSRIYRLRSPELENKFGVKSSLKLIENLDRSLSATQLGITVASLTLGWWGEHVFQQLFVHTFAAIGEPYTQILSHATATVMALLMITILHVVIGELVAKSIAIRYPETTLRMVAPFAMAFTKLSRPIVATLSFSADLCLRMVGLTRAPEHDLVHSSAELAMLISQSTQKGILDKDEEEMLQGVFEFSKTVAREVMTPRPDLVMIPVDSSLEEVIELISKSGFSRFPVVGGSVDDVRGVLLMRDLFPFLGERILSGRRDEFRLDRIIRQPYFIPGTKPIDDLLNEFKDRKLHMAIVLDEHGGVDGAVTLEDLIEEIVGEIYDESDIPEKAIIELESGDVLLDGGVLAGEINDRYELHIPVGDYDTIAGFMFTSLGRMPVAGDQVLLYDDGSTLVEEALRGDGKRPELRVVETPVADEDAEDGASLEASFRVEKVKGHRISRISLRRYQQKGEPLDSESTDDTPASQSGGA